MIQITDNEVHTTQPESKRVHRIGTNAYFVKCTKLANDSAANFEEVLIEDIPDPEAEEDKDEKKDWGGVIYSKDIKKVQVMTQQEYDALEEKDLYTEYNIIDQS